MFSLVCFVTPVTLELFLALLAHQPERALSSKIVDLMLVELQAAESLFASRALERLVATDAVSLVCALWAHEVYVSRLMIGYCIRLPSCRVVHVFAGRAPVVERRQMLLPHMSLFQTTLAFCGFLLSSKFR